MVLFLGLLAIAITALVIVHSIMVWRFARTLRKVSVPLLSDNQAPRALVMLCLRGTDPYLKKCLLSVLYQDYPTYEIRIVIDSPEDPAHRVVNEVLKDTGATNVRVANLREVRPECSLKCSSIRQILDSLEPEFEIVAQLDADTIVHRTWLRELATALHPDDVGLATGNRWYMPANPSLGAVVRYIWNAGAVVQMHWHSFAWGGCFAIKRRVLRESNLLRRWGRAFCDDTVLVIPVRKLGLRVTFVPSLMMINRENISLRSFYDWVCRQMLNVRLYHPAWPAIVAHTVVSTILPSLAVVFLLSGIWQENVLATRILASSLALYGVSLGISLLLMVKQMRCIASRRGEQSHWISGWHTLKLFVALPLTQIIQCGAILSATFAKSTTWRGIRYYIEGRWKIRMDEYTPYYADYSVTADDSLG